MRGDTPSGYTGAWPPSDKEAKVVSTVTYSVPGVSCAHCREAIEGEVSQVAGVEAVNVDLDAKTVSVEGDALDEEAIVAAIDEAGYEVVK